MPKDIVKTEESLTADMYLMASLILGFIAFLMNNYEFGVASMFIMVVQQTYAKAKFDNLFTFIPLLFFIFILFRQN